MTGPPEPPRLLLAGRPGSGKTTAIARLVALLRADGLVLTDSLTRELRERGQRVGFTLKHSTTNAACSPTFGSAVQGGESGRP